MQFFQPRFDFGARIKKLQKKLAAAKADAIIIGSGHGVDANAYYYCGDTAFPSFLIATRGGCAVYSTQPPEQFSSFADSRPLSKFKTDFKKLLSSKNAKTIAFDPHAAGAAGLLLELQKKKKAAIAFHRQLREIRLVKDAEEIKCIRFAQKISNECLRELHRMAARGQLFGETENYLAGVMEFRARQMHASLDSFPPLIQTGARASVFHEATSNAVARENEVLLADIGAKYCGYCGDATTTIYGGKDKQTKDALEAVWEAKKAAEKKARAGVFGKTLSQTALNVLREYGFKKGTFREAGLSIGHFVGLEVHDGPSLEGQRLGAGMCFTVEPGIYVPKKFGVRFEDVTIL
ncbi:MAG: M24 family metallopeptidase [Candidatus Micrarchaeia archaeon]|jgi:Xaa-Pro aminopeptidase